MQTVTPLTEQLANINPLWIVLVAAACTLLRIAVVRSRSGWAYSVSEACQTITFVLIFVFVFVNPLVGRAYYIPSGSMRQTLLENDRLIVDKISYRLHEPQRGDVVVFNAPLAATNGVEGINYIKRLVGLPGDIVEVRAAHLRFGSTTFNPSDYGLSTHEFLRSRLNLAENDWLKFTPDAVIVDGTRRITKAEVARAVGFPGAPVTIVPGSTRINGKPQPEPFTREDPDYDFGPIRVEPGHLLMFGDNRNFSADSHMWGLLDRSRVVGQARFVFWPLPRLGAIR